MAKYIESERLAGISDDEVLERASQILGVSVSEMQSAAKFKQKYIDLLKEECVDLCEHCVNQVRCERKKCPKYIEGRGGTIDGRFVDFSWSCLDFDWGDCPLMEDTPCYGCYKSDYDGFVLKEEN